MKDQSNVRNSNVFRASKKILLVVLLAIGVCMLYEASSIAPPQETIKAETNQNMMKLPLSGVSAVLPNNINNDKVNHNLSAGVTATLSDTMSELERTYSDEKITPTAGVSSYMVSQLHFVTTESKELDIVGSSYVDEKVSEPEPEPEPEYPTSYDLNITGYTTARKLNIRKEPNTDSEILGQLTWNNEVSYAIYDDNWAAISYGDSYGYIHRSYISDTKIDGVLYNVSGDNPSRKSFMDWNAITSTTSRQYILQHNYASTDITGIRVVDGRYCIALGSYFTKSTGQYVDLILENGTVLECIIGDAKRDYDTNASNTIGVDGGVAEFVVSTGALSTKCRQHGSMSQLDGWMSPVVQIIVYDKNLFE